MSNESTSPSHKCVLKVRDLGADEAAIRKTLDYAQGNCTVLVCSSEALADTTVELVVQETREGGEEFHIRGFLPCFAYASRLAHTLPQDPLLCGIVLERLSFVRTSPLWYLEDELKHMKGGWLCGQRKGSTLSNAADFYLFCRLQKLKTDNPEVLTDLPILEECSRMDPSLCYDEGEEDTAEEDAAEEDAAEGDAAEEDAAEGDAAEEDEAEEDEEVVQEEVPSSPRSAMGWSSTLSSLVSSSVAEKERASGTGVPERTCLVQ